MENGFRPSLDYIYVHGLHGWGSYEWYDRLFPYWGTWGGDLMKRLRRRGFPCFSASVDPLGSAWDRACELYAQLAGTVTDYGKEHSARFGHPRFGRDYSGCPLLPDRESGNKTVLIGHSFGGATVRLFAELLANGSPEERDATDPADLSPLFAGGQGDRVFAVVTLAAPGNGTTAYELQPDGEVSPDTAAFDMHVDNALALNERIRTLPGTYYFAVPCSATEPGPDGSRHPVRSLSEPMYRRISARMGAFTGVTAGGTVIGDEWKDNDGLVNTVSAGAPSGAPWVPFDPEDVRPGVWNVLPVQKSSHVGLKGGLLKYRDILPFHLGLLETIAGLPRDEET